LTRGGTIFRGIFADDTPRDRRHGDDVLGADPLTRTAAGTALFIDYRQSFWPHGNGIKRAGFDATTEAQATDRADLHAAAQVGSSTAVAQASVNIFKVGILHPVGASESGNIRFFGFNGYTHNGSNRFRHFRPGRHT